MPDAQVNSPDAGQVDSSEVQQVSHAELGLIDPSQGARRKLQGARRKLQGARRKLQVADVTKGVTGRSLLWPGERGSPIELDTAFAYGVNRIAPGVQAVLVQPSDSLPDYVVNYVQHYVYFGSYLIPSFADTWISNGTSR